MRERTFVTFHQPSIMGSWRHIIKNRSRDLSLLKNLLSALSKISEKASIGCVRFDQTISLPALPAFAKCVVARGVSIPLFNGSKSGFGIAKSLKIRLLIRIQSRNHNTSSGCIKGLRTDPDSVSRAPPDVVVLDVRKVAEVVEESLSAVAALLGPRVVPQVVVGARVVEGAALDHVKVARAEDLVVAVVRRHGHPLVVLLT